MKKHIVSLIGFLLITFFSLVFTTEVNSQDQIFDLGHKDINIGLGLGSTYYHGSHYSTTLPPISISFDYGFKDDVGPGIIGIGGYLGLSSYKYENRYNTEIFGYKYSVVTVAARASYHYTFTDKLDTYGGLILGLRFVSDTYYGNLDLQANLDSDAGVGLALSLFIGAKYYFTDNLAAFCELGYGVSWLTIGIALKL